MIDIGYDRHSETPEFVSVMDNSSRSLEDQILEHAEEGYCSTSPDTLNNASHKQGHSRRKHESLFPVLNDRY